ncbi:MAG: hypothetical protein QOF81_69 [Acidimicrobiaceae bacterium]|jgi:hypothetical protein|nr:hypothetical protein [Acidimicrobiaceae bacterium]MDQ1364116.1 hypothetical protein [Acidimicrobiaceae bacterium]MDQ1378419.1 hypothetical protein [Acidimicrobiaceae bacterium]MDQ1414456.1 hypothetical protein [Acidimicrobiaceae bacterium]
MTTTAVAPLEMTPAQLDELFGSSPAGDIPVGRGKGTAILFGGRPAAKRFATFVRLVLWHGKVFRPETHDLKNLLTPLSLKGLRAEVYTGESWYDGRPCVVLDYSKSSKLAGQIRDEIRQIGPGEYVGMVFRGARRLNVYFFLRFG